MSTTIDDPVEVSSMDWLPASTAESAAWHGSQVENNAGAYLVPLQYRVDGVIDLADLRRAVDVVAAATDACRLEFRVEDGTLLRRVASDARRDLVVDAGPDPATGTLPFSGSLDLEGGERFRVLAFGIDGKVHRILAVFDHTAFDGPAAASVVRRVASVLRGDQIAHVALAEPLEETGAAEARAVDHWTGLLDHLGRVDGSAVETGALVEGRTVVEDVPHGDECMAVLDNASRRSGVSALGVLGAAVSMLAATMTGSERVAVGIPFDLRRLSELRAIGAFADVLPVPTVVRPGVALDEHAGEFAQSLFAVARHRNVGRKAIAAAGAGETAWFPYYANAVHVDDVDVYGETRLLAEIPPFYAARFGVACYLLRTPRESRLLLVAEHPLVEEGWRRLLAAQLSSLIRTGRPIVVPDEAEGVEPSCDSLPRPGGSWVGEGAQLVGPDGAIVESDVLRTARLVRADGDLRPITTVAIVGDVSLELVQALVAAAEMGLRVILLGPNLPETELVARVTTTRCDAWWSLDDVPLDDDSQVRLEIGVDSSAAPDRFSVVGFTSGSTGTARAVICDASALRTAFGWYSRALAIDPGARFGICSAVGHDPFLRDTLLPLAAGARTVVPPGNMGQLDGWVRDASISVLNLTPTRAAMVLRLLSGDQEVLPSLRHVVLGGEALSRDLAAEMARVAPEARIWNAFGVTETPQVQTLHDWQQTAPEMSWHRRTVPIGVSGLGRVLVLDRRNGLPAPLGVVGDVVIRSRVVARPVGGRPTASTVATGDLGLVAPDGTIAYRGRADHQLSVGGELVDPLPIEAALARHPDVLDAAVLIESQTGVLSALVATDERPALHDLRALVETTLARSHVPARYLAVTGLPRLSNGKLDRAALPTALASAQPIVERYVPPVGEDETVIARTVEQVLGLVRIGRYDRWTSHGADSLRLTRILGALGAAFRERDGELRYATVRSNDTVASLSSLLVARGPQVVRRGTSTRGLGDALSETARELHAAAVLEQERGVDNFVSVALLLRGRGSLSERCVEALRGVLEEARLDRVTVEDVDGVLRWGRSPSWGVPLIEREPAPGWWRQPADDVRRTPLGVSGSPLAAAAVVRGGEDVMVAVKVDHQVCDGESLALLLDRFVGRVSGRPVGPLRPATDAPTPWPGERPAPWNWIDGNVLSTATLPAATRSTSSLERAHRLLREVPLDVVRGLRRRCLEAGVTEFAGLLAIVAHVVARHLGGVRSVLLWVPMSRRVLDQADEVGMLTRLTPVVVNVDRSQPLKERLRSAEASLHRSMAEEGTAAALASRLREIGHGATVPQVILAHQRALVLPDGDVDVLPDERPRVIAPLCLRFDSSPEGISLAVDHASELVDPWTAKRVADHLLDTIGAFASPDVRLELPDADPVEAARVTEELQAIEVTHGGLDPAAGLIETVRQWPKRPAVAWDEGSLDHEEFARLVEGIASGLDDLGVPSGAAVAVELARGPRLVATVFALYLTGRIYLPIQPDLPPDRRADMLSRSGAVARVSDRTPPGVGLPTLDAHSVEPATGDPAEALHRRFELSSSLPNDREAYRIFTSGSTGVPKCVSVSVDSIRQHLRWMQDRYRLGPDDAVAFKTPIGFDPSVWELLWALGVGARLAIAREGGHVDGDYLIDFVERHRVTVMHVVPTLLATFLEHGSFERCRALRLLVSSGEALPPETVRRFAGQNPAQVVNLYGPTEATIDVSYFEPAANHTRAMPIGRAVRGTALLVLDPDGGLLPAGVLGEIAIAGVQLALGYVGNQEETSRRFPSVLLNGRPVRVYRTGDLGVVDEDGALHYRGRTDRQVKVGGVRIELGEVEHVLERDPRVAEARSVAVRDGDVIRLTAFVRLSAPGVRVALGDVLRVAKRALPSAALPRLVVVEAFPLLPNGKTDFSQLLEAAVRRDERETERVQDDLGVASRDADPTGIGTEVRVARIWQDVLGVEVATDANFFAVGGNSMDAVRIVAAMRAAGYRLDAADILGNPVLTDLVRLVAGSREDDGPPSTQVTGGRAFSLLSADDLAKIGQTGQ